VIEKVRPGYWRVEYISGLYYMGWNRNERIVAEWQMHDVRYPRIRNGIIRSADIARSMTVEDYDQLRNQSREQAQNQIRDIVDREEIARQRRAFYRVFNISRVTSWVASPILSWMVYDEVRLE